MLFLDSTTFSATAEIRFSACEATTKRRQSAWMNGLFAFPTILFIGVCAIFFPITVNAQTSPKKSDKILTLEEATGTTTRDFDALRVMSADYLANPDGGNMPVDEDDLWTPELALGSKNPASSLGRRVISYDNGKMTSTVEEQSAIVKSPAKETPTTSTTATKTVETDAVQAPSGNGVASAEYSSLSNANLQQSTTANAAQVPSTNGLVSANYSEFSSSPGYIQQTQALVQTGTYAETDSEANVVSSFEPKEESVYSTAQTVETTGGGFSGYTMNSEVLDSNINLEPQTVEINDFPVTNAFEDVATLNEGATTSNAEMTATLDNYPSTDFNSANDASLAPEIASGTNSLPEAPMASNSAFPTLNASNAIEVPNATEVPQAFEIPSATEVPQITEPMGTLDYASEDVVGSFDSSIGNSDINEPFRETFYATPRQAEEPAASTPKSNEQSLESASLSENELKNLTIEDVRISGLEMSTQQFNKIIKTRIGAKFSQQRLEEDKRALLQTKQFIDVAVSTSWSPDNPDKVIVNFDLTPRRMLRYIKVVGNKKIAKREILEELGLKPGESRMDPYEVENGRIRIIELYKTKDYAEPYVEILRGDRPEDVGVVYIIDEGRKQRVLKTSFVGNTIVSSARLRSLISVKPGVLYFIGGAFTRDRLDADVEKLLEYYRQLGYFDAKIDREYEESAGFAGLGKDNAWVSVRYIIDEGPRYKIRNFLFNGNRVLTSEELEKKLKVKRGSYYNYGDVEADRIALRYKYQDLGYVRADVTPNQLFTDEVGVVDIRYDIKEDHRYRVQDVIVDYVGTESRTMTPVVLNMLDLTPGELLNGKKIRMSENTLRQSGYFNDKPSEGQLPEIAVVPDESRSFTVQKQGTMQVVKEARRQEDSESKDEKDADAPKTQRGQVAPSQSPITRGQNVEESGRRSALYAPYQENVNGTKNQILPTSYRSYGPSSEQTISNGTIPAQQSQVGTSVGYQSYDSVVRGQGVTIPSGFSDVTTVPRASSNGDSTGYRSYDSVAVQESQYSQNSYANNNLLSTTEAPATDYQSLSNTMLSTEAESAPGFADGAYSSIGKEMLEPITPETDEIYNGNVLVKVQEGRTGMFTASVGVNSDYGLVGNVSFTERNFNMFRLPTSCWRADGWKDAFRGGGQIFSAQASPGTTVQSYRVSWDVPYIFNTKNTFGITGLYGDHSYDEWFEARYGGELRLGRQWSPRFSTTLSGGIYGVKIKDPQVDFVPDLNEVIGTHPMYTLGLSAAYDTRNHPYSPSDGFLAKGTIEQVLGDYKFPRVSLDGRYYKTLRKRADGSGRWVLGLSSKLGWNGDDAPIYERFYGGGTYSLRGFEYRGVTPRYLDTGFGVGGNFEFYNTAELLVPVSGGDEFQLAFFVDTGTVAKSIKEWGKYRVAPGFGLRFSIPMLGPAPLALDFAFPVNKDPEDVTEVFSFSMSGAR